LQVVDETSKILPREVNPGEIGVVIARQRAAASGIEEGECPLAAAS
jgi:hypothetical protein